MIILYLTVIAIGLAAILILLPIHLELRLNLESATIRIDKIFRFKVDIKKLLEKLTSQGFDPEKVPSERLIIGIASAIRVDKITIEYIVGRADYAHLALANGVVATLLPLLRAVLNDNLNTFYFKSRTDRHADLRIQATAFVSLLLLLKAVLSNKRMIKNARRAK